MKANTPLIIISALITILVSSCTTDSPSDADSIDVTPIEKTLVADPEKMVEVMLSKPEITVYKSSTCGCCKGWVTYLEVEGFAVKSIDHDNMDKIKTELGLTDPGLKSCHTAVVDGYIVEGHVPANDIERLLAEHPDEIMGISAPGMPMASPGMGSRIPKDYTVLSFTEGGDTAVFSEY